jgi:hypothetical protein
MALTPEQKRYLDSLPREQVIKMAEEAKAAEMAPVNPSPVNRVGGFLGKAALGGLKAFAGDTYKGDTSSDLAEKMELERYKAGLKKTNPVIRNVGGSLVQIDPETQQVETLIEKGPSETEELKTELIRQRVESNQQKTEEAQEKKRNQGQVVIDAAYDSLNDIAQVKAGLKYFGAGALIGGIPGLQPGKVRWESYLNKLLSGKVLDVMNKMKQASRTGATGFGALNKEELKVLSDASTALKKTLDPEDALAILNEMEKKLKKIAGEGEEGGIAPEASDPEYDSYLKAIGGQ